MRLVSARDGQEDYDTLCALEEMYIKLAGEYGYESDKVINALDESLSVYYEMLYNDAYAYNDEANFERVRRAVGGLTEAAYSDAQMMIVPQSVEGGASSMLKIYSNADKIWVNGKALTKAQDYHAYATKLSVGKNSITIRYEVEGKTYSFEYFLANARTNYAVSDMSSASTIGTGSSIAVVGNALDIKAVSYGGSNAKKLDFFLPMNVEFANVDNLNFTIKNTCAEQIEFEVYVKSASSNILVDKVVVFPYETYAYSLNYLYEKVEKAGTGVNGITLRFTNYTKDGYGNMLALPDRTLKLYDFSYSLK
jgi:hypothetical protein